MIELLIFVIGVSTFIVFSALPILVLHGWVENHKAYSGPRAEEGVVIPLFNFSYGKPQVPLFNFYHGKG